MASPSNAQNSNQQPFDMHNFFNPSTAAAQPSRPPPQNAAHGAFNVHPNTPPPNPGTHLLALINNNNTDPSPQNAEFSQPPPSRSVPSSVLTRIPTDPRSPMMRLPSFKKQPKGRTLVGDNLVYDIDLRLPNEMQPQLEVTPITKYVSDPQLVIGRQIAVNKVYICYGLKHGNIRVLNINTASRYLLRGHTQRVTDMAFFADDVHLLASVSVEGRINIWEISEGLDEDDKPQITENIIAVIQIVGGENCAHPRVCWYCHKQEALVVGIGRRVFKIDTTKIGKGRNFTAETPLQCPVDQLIDGVYLIGEHEGEVTDISMCQWMITRLVSASTDGVVKIWDDRKAQPLAVLKPHDSQPVHSAMFLAAPTMPSHIVLVTSGPLNREVKIWSSASEEGWLLPTNTDTWKCIQTLVMKSSSETWAEKAFFNQVIALPQSGFILIANAKRKSIYAIHIEYGSTPVASRMDYISEFTVTIPILSFTAISDSTIKVYCVQTQAIQQYALDLRQCLPPEVEIDVLENSDFSSDENLRNEGESDNLSREINPDVVCKRPTHLVTPSEILMAVSSSETTTSNSTIEEMSIHDVVDNSDMANGEVEVKVVGETKPTQNAELARVGGSQIRVPENRENIFCSQASVLGIEMAREYDMDEARQTDSIGENEKFLQPVLHEEDIHVSGQISESLPSIVQKSVTPSTKSKKQKGRNSQVPGPTSQSRSIIVSTDSNNEPGGSSSHPSMETAFSQITGMQETLNKMMTMQKELLKQFSNLVTLPVTKEGKRLETSLVRSTENVVRANNDALWARFQEENDKNEKLSQDLTQQTTSLVTNFLSKDLTGMSEKAVKTEAAAVVPNLIRNLSPAIDEIISSAVIDSFQRGVGDKAVNQLEKSVNSKIEATVARQIQAQFQTSGKQALQASLKTSVEASVIPAFEKSCKSMFDQVDATFQKGMAEHSAAAQQHFETAHTPMALTLRDTINSASSVIQTLSGELADGQRKLFAAAQSNNNNVNPLITQLSNGTIASLHEKASLDPTKELSRLLSEHKYEEAFTVALQRSDLTIVSWLCSQVDMQSILSTVPIPLSQGVLLSLLQQLACDINNDASKKLTWMTDVAASIDPAHQTIVMHARRIFEQVYQILLHQRNSSTMTRAELSSVRLLMHVINSMLMTCK